MARFNSRKIVNSFASINNASPVEPESIERERQDQLKQYRAKRPVKKIAANPVEAIESRNNAPVEVVFEYCDTYGPTVKIAMFKQSKTGALYPVGRDVYLSQAKLKALVADLENGGESARVLDAN